MTNEERAHEVAMMAAKTVAGLWSREEDPAKTADAYLTAYKTVMRGFAGRTIAGPFPISGGVTFTPHEIKTPGWMHADGTVRGNPE